MNSTNLPTIIDRHVHDLDKISGIKWKSERKPSDTATIPFTDTRLRARITEDMENHVLPSPILWRTEPDDPIHTDGCVEHSEALDHTDAPESVPQETTWNPFKEIRPAIHQYDPHDTYS